MAKHVMVLGPGLFDKGGISRYGRYQVRALTEALGGRSVSVFSLMGRSTDDIEEAFDVTFAGAMPLSTSSRCQFALECIKFAASVRPDTIVSQHLNLAPLGHVLRKASGANRFICNIYGSEVWSPISRPRKSTLRRCDFLISDCYNTAEKALQLQLTKQMPKVVWDCVDEKRFYPANCNWKKLEKYGYKNNEGEYRIVSLGRICKSTMYKGYLRLLRILQRTPQEVIGVFAGGGDGHETIRDEAIRLGVSTRVKLLGSIAEDDLVDVYRSADVFYLVSEVGENMGEGLPLTPIEAMACGVPIIVGNQDGSREILRDGGGICVSPNDVEETCGYLTKLFSQVDFRDHESKEALRRIDDSFSFKSFATKMVSEILT